MPKYRRGEIQLHIRLYPGQDDELLAWLATLDGRPYGEKARAVKAALRRSIEAAASPASPVVDPFELRTVIEDAIAALAPRPDLSELSQMLEAAIAAASTRVDLSELRQVVEAAVDTALARFGARPAGDAAAPEEDDEAEALLDDLQTALVLADS